MVCNTLLDEIQRTLNHAHVLGLSNRLPISSPRALLEQLERA
jgi:hypothetical protein